MYVDRMKEIGQRSSWSQTSDALLLGLEFAAEKPDALHFACLFPLTAYRSLILGLLQIVT